MAEYKVTREMAESLTHFIYESTGYHAIVCNQEGLIVGDSDRGKRIGSKHEGSIKILKGHLDEYVVTPEDVKGNPALIKPLDAPNVNRECFYRDLDKNDYQYIVDKYISSPSSKQSLRRKLVNLLHFGRLLKDACGWSVPTFIKNLKYNFFSRQKKTDILAGKYMVIYKHSIIELHKNARIDINGIFRVGKQKI